MRLKLSVLLATLAVTAFFAGGCADGSYQHNPLRRWLLDESVTFTNPAGIEETWKIDDFAILHFAVERVRFVDREGSRQYTGYVRFRLFDPPTRRTLEVRGAFTYRDGERHQWELQKEKWYPLEVKIPTRWSRSPIAGWIKEQTVEFNDGPLKKIKWPVSDCRVRDMELGQPEVIAIRADNRLVYQRPISFTLQNTKTRMTVLVIGSVTYRDGQKMPWNLEFEEFETTEVRILE